MKGTKLDKAFSYGIGCVGLVGVLATVITLFVAITQPTQVISVLQQVAGLTPTAVLIVVTSEVDSASVPTKFPTYTLPPTYTPLPTYTTAPQPSNTPFQSSTPTPKILLPFLDTFELRLGSEWQPVLGTWRVVNGRLATDPTGGWRRILVGDPAWRDYAVDVDVWSEDWFYPVQIIVRAQQGGYIALQTNIHDTEFILYASGDSHIIAHSDVGVDDSGGGRYKWNYHIRVEANGDLYTVYLDGTRLLQVQDATFNSGHAGLAFETASYMDSTWFDNFQVAALP